VVDAHRPADEGGLRASIEQKPRARSARHSTR
jgi:hypothetical protein